MKNKFLIANSFLDIKEINDYFLQEYKKINETFEDNPTAVGAVLTQLKKAHAKAIKAKRKDLQRTDKIASRLRRKQASAEAVNRHILEADNVPDVTSEEKQAQIEAIKQHALHKAYYDLNKEWRAACEAEKEKPTGKDGKPSTVPKPTEADLERRTKEYAAAELQKAGFNK